MFLSPSISNFKTNLLILLVLWITTAYCKYTILSTPVQLTFDQYSAIKEVRLRFMPEASFYKNDHMMISFSEALQDNPNAITPLNFIIMTQFSTEMASGSLQFVSDLNLNDVNNLNMSMFRNGLASSYMSDLSLASWYINSSQIKSQWLTMVIKVQRDLSNSFGNRLASVNMAIVSSQNSEHIKYQYSNAISYFYFASLGPATPPQLITARIANNLYGKPGESGLSQIPGALYPVYLQLQAPTLDYSNFQLNIQFTSLTQILVPLTAPKVFDFKFQGTCYFICQSSITCITALSCDVKNDKIQVNIAQMIATQKYVLRITVLNPPYQASANFLLWVDYIGSAFDMATVVTPAVLTLPISIAEDPLKLLWKIPVTSLPDGLGFFIDGGINTVQVGFMISSSSPFGEVLQIEINLGTDQLIMQSIDHNLPSINTTISYSFLQPVLTIYNVTALTKTSFRYWVAFRARYITSDIARLGLIGSTDIRLIKYPTKLLFNPMTTTGPRPNKPWTSYLDAGGFHSPGLLMKNVDTQVISASDNSLQNGTSQAVRKYFSQTTTVGVDPSIPNQQLIFLLKATSANVASTAALTSDKYDTRIYFNPNVLQTVSDKGLQVIAYNTVTSKWDTEGNLCYFDQSGTPIIQTFMCQKYRDHIRSQYDNILVVPPALPQFPHYQFSCGRGRDANSKIMCNKTIGDCLNQCTLFKGYGLTPGASGIAAIRNVTFISGYQSPIQASDKNLDFIVAFFQNDVLVSASLINAYTLKFDNLQQASFSLINTYNDGNIVNLGQRVPTLLKFEGRLALSEYVNLGYPDKIKIYLPPNAVKMNHYMISTHELGCTYVCRLNQSYSTGVTQNWLEMYSVVVENMPVMTNSFKVLLPVELVTDLLSLYVGFETSGRLVAIYRFSGSAVKQSIWNPMAKIFTVQAPPTVPWTDLGLDWTICPLPTCDYKQKINLQQTNVQNNFTLIAMAQSLMPYYLTPYVTVTIRNIQVLADYTTIIVGNSLRNRSCDKFNYYFGSKKIQTFVCEMYTNDNTSSNNIRINFPLFMNWLGSRFPYDQIFTYAYASGTDGRLEAIRRQTDDLKTVNLCRTNKATQYNIGEEGRQLEIFRIQIEPINLSPSTYTSLRVTLQLPNNIIRKQCSAYEAIFNTKLTCSIQPPVSNIAVIILQLIGTQPVTLIDFYIHLNVEQPVPITLTAGTIYKVSIRLPHDSNGIETIYGTSYTGFSSLAYQCQNSFTYINAAYNRTILINSHQLNTIALNLNTELEFNLSFSRQKSHLLQNSLIEFIFRGLLVTEQTYCYMRGFEHVFWTKQWAADRYKLVTNKDIAGYTDNQVTVKCSNLILTGLSPSLVVKVHDLSVTPTEIMTSRDTSPYYVMSHTPYFSGTPLTINNGSISSKQFKTLGFNGQYTLTYSFSGSGLVQGFIDISEYSLDQRIVGCSLNIAQDVFCRVQEMNTNSDLEFRTRFIYFKTFYPNSFTSIVLTIYPLLQQKQLVAPLIRTFLKIGNNAYYVPIVDTLPLNQVDDVFFIKSYNIVPMSNLTSVKFNLQLNYQFDLPISQPLYVQLNQILFYNSIVGVTLRCTINGIAIPCSSVQKDLIRVNTFSYNATDLYLLCIESFQPNYQIALRDKQNFYLRAFVIDPSTKQIDYVSYLNTDLILATALMTLIKSYQASVNKPSLIWNLTDSRGLVFLPKIYVGYFGKPIQLVVYDGSNYVSQFALSSPSYTASTFKCEMGLKKCELALVADSMNSVIKQFNFTHSNSYYMQPSLLQVEVSSEKCILTTQFNNYKLYQNGTTLPIILNFTHCRPRSMLKINIRFSSPELSTDTSLSQLDVSNENPIGIIFVKHSSTNISLGTFNMLLSLSGTHNQSFVIPSSLVIEKIARTESNIQGKVPQMLNLAQNQITVRIQCNQPSTVYWAIGFFPKTLGQEGEDIQTRLLNGQIGLRTSIYDPLTYGNLQYGLTYTDTPNVWKHLNIKNILGNSVYTFKYFCVNIRGSFSDGQILTFTTPQSTFQTVKLTLGFNAPLTFASVNNYACAIAQSLTIQYSSVKSSVNTNCKNAPLIFYQSTQDVVWDFNTSGQNAIFFNSFYITSTTKPSQTIVSTIKDKLQNTQRILSNDIPFWTVFNIQQIQPNAITPIFYGQAVVELSQTTITMALPIKNQLCFVVVGFLSNFYNETSMSLPETYMIKEGKFSQNVDFDKVFMNYTTGNITFKFDGLTADTQYSVFYYVTVDSPAINAKHSQVKYLNLMTTQYLTIDLFGRCLLDGKYFLVLLLMAILYFS